MVKSNSLPSAGHYNANYENFQTELYAEIRAEAFGEDIGQNSWLTVAEQDKYLEWLELGDGANATGERVLHYRGDSDSHLVRGLIAIALALYSDRTVREILSSDAQAFFREFGS